MRLGIDFGTCFSSAALMIDGNLKLVRDPRKAGFSFPSSVYVSPQGEISIGHSANYQKNKDLTRYRSEFKRDLGRDIPYQLGERQFLPENLVAEVLRKLKSEADRMVMPLGCDSITDVVITVPATYQEYKRGLMQKAATSAGFKKINLLDEPVATAIDCARRLHIADNEIILIYDLGGGTFDAALLQKQGESSYEFLTLPVGDDRCGGVDFDREIYQDLIGRCSQPLRDLLTSRERTQEVFLARSIVADTCRDLKHQLSEEDEAQASLIVPGVGSIESYEIDRATFNRSIEPHLNKTLQLCQQLVKNASLTWDRVDRVLLVGGSCRIPYIKQLLERELKRPVYLVDEPDLSVCQGAAILGDRLDEMDKNDRPKTVQPQTPPTPTPQTQTATIQELCRQGSARNQERAYVKAIEAFNQGISIDSNCGEAYYGRGVARYGLGDIKGAISDLETAKDIFFSQNRLAEYQQMLEKIKEIDRPKVNPTPNATNPTPNPDLHSSQKANPNVDRVPDTVIGGNNNDKDNASPNWVFTKDSTEDPKENDYDRGVRNMWQEDYRGAIAAFDRWININPNHDKAYILRGFARLYLEDNSGALDDCNRAAAVNPTCAEADICRGFVNFCKGEHYVSLQDFTRSLKLDPSLGIAYLGRAVVNSFMGYHPRAIADLNQLRRLVVDFNNNDFNKVLANTVRGNKRAVVEFLQQNTRLLFRN
jgi:tetratricopeptide (TPR) repeat protein